MHPVPATEDHIVAAIIDAPGATPRVGLIEPGDRGPRTTRIRVVAAPLNPLDLLIASGSFHSVRHESPYVPGSECVGVVLESETYAVGAWVYAECHASPKTPGTLASQVVVDDASMLLLPPGLDAVLAAAVGNAGTAAYIPLVEEAGLVESENVLVLGATGAVGQIAVQLAKARGAARVVGVARTLPP
jgi:NADPH:quinone reductase